MKQRERRRAAVIAGAGGVVINHQLEVLLIRYPGKRGSWDFPKGHIDPGETIELTALREVQEESGVNAQIVSRLSSTAYINPRGEARRIDWFLMRTTSTTATPEPGFQAGFFPVTDALHKLGHEQNRALLLEATAMLEASM